MIAKYNIDEYKREGAKVFIKIIDLWEIQYKMNIIDIIKCKSWTFIITLTYVHDQKKKIQNCLKFIETIIEGSLVAK